MRENWPEIQFSVLLVNTARFVLILMEFRRLLSWELVQVKRFRFKVNMTAHPAHKAILVKMDNSEMPVMRVNFLVLEILSVRLLNVQILYATGSTCPMDAQLVIKLRPTHVSEILTLGMLVFIS